MANYLSISTAGGWGAEGVADMACRGSTEAAAELEEDDAAAASKAWGRCRRCYESSSPLPQVELEERDAHTGAELDEARHCRSAGRKSWMESGGRRSGGRRCCRPAAASIWRISFLLVHEWAGCCTRVRPGEVTSGLFFRFFCSAAITFHHLARFSVLKMPLTW